MKPGKPCPVCERLVTRCERLSLRVPSWEQYERAVMCSQCATVLRSLLGQRCRGWIHGPRRIPEGQAKTCQQWGAQPICGRCGRSPLLELLQSRGVEPNDGSACPICLARGRGIVPLREEGAEGPYVHLSCRCCREEWMITRTGHDFAQYVSGLSTRLMTAQFETIQRGSREHRQAG